MTLVRVPAHLTTYHPQATGKRMKMEGGPSDAKSRPILSLDLVLKIWEAVDGPLEVVTAVVGVTDSGLLEMRQIRVPPKRFHVTVAVDFKMIKRGTWMLIPLVQLTRNLSQALGALTHVWAKATDTGGNFGVVRKVYRFRGYEPIDVAWDETGPVRPLHGKANVFIET